MKTFIVLMTLVSFPAFSASKILIKDASIRLSPPGSVTTAAYAMITNHLDHDVELVSIEGDFAKTFELHNMEMQGGVMRMRKMASIPVKKHESVELKSGGLHIMIFDLKKPLNPNEKYNLKFNFSNKEKIEVQATVN